MPGRLLRSSPTPSDTEIVLSDDPSYRRAARTTGGQTTHTPSPMEQLKKHSLAVIGKSKHKDKDLERKGSPGPLQKPVKPTNSLDVAIESPPALFHGNANSSTGALYAGHLQVKVVDPELTLNSLALRLVAVTTVKKPVAKDCADCAAQTTQLKQWDFLTYPRRFQQGSHSLPFSYLIPGHLPTTTHGDLGMIQYFLIAKGIKACPNPTNGIAHTETLAITTKCELTVTRAVRPLDSKASLRIFPPTNLTARVTHEPIIHPLGDISVEMLVSGISEKHKETIARWRLRRMNWRLEETEKMISPACNKHAVKVGGQGRGIAHEDVRHVGRGEMKSGWKTDLTEGQIELDFVVRPSKPMCDVDSPNGLVVTHSLVIELVIAEEWAKISSPEKAVPTGAARILRMQFAVMVTERAGMGISWDEEQPPMYEDVPASPPWYPSDMMRAPGSRGAPPGYPGYAEGIEEEETQDMQRSRSELLNYTGTPLGLGTEAERIDVDEEEFEGLTLGPSRMVHRRTSRGTAGPSRLGRGSTDSDSGRQRLDAADFDTIEPVPPQRDDNSTPRPPSPQQGQVS